MNANHIRHRSGLPGLLRWALGLVILATLAAGLQACTNAQAAPESTFVLLDGSKKTTADFKGKVMLVNFWATSCVTCVAEMPKLISTHQKYAAKGYDTLAVAMSYDPPSYVVNYTETTPTTYLVNKRGEIVKQYIGEPDFTALHLLIEKLLAQS
jgi:thiol-disulfide isomerase/thioredoxin